jgi:pimeloyl-ACP methyl ester carboxylesterase
VSAASEPSTGATSDRLESTDLGDGDRQVVFVHGVLDRGRAFGRVARQLQGECRVRWYDRRGYGASRDADHVPAGIDRHVDDLLAVLNGETAVVVGHSFGGVVALGAAAAAPELVEAVVLYETNIAWTPGWDDGAMRLVHESDDPEGEALRLMMGDALATQSAEEERTWRLEARAFVTEEASVRGRAPFELAEVAAPIVYGCSDPATMPPVVAFVAAQVDDMELVVLPGAGHAAHRSAPAAFADLVRSALERSSSRAAGGCRSSALQP